MNEPNTTTVSENARKAGSTKSEAKAAAARENGKLGGETQKGCDLHWAS